MATLLRNRTLNLMIAVLAFVLFTFAPQMLCQQMADGASATPGAPACHAMQPDAKPPLQGGSQHACCKLCVCHPGITALPTTAGPQPLLRAGQPLLYSALAAAPPARRFTTKSSPRGPPLPL